MAGHWRTDAEPSQVNGYPLRAQSFESGAHESELREANADGSSYQLRNASNNPSGFVPGSSPSSFLPLMNVTGMETSSSSWPSGHAAMPNSTVNAPILRTTQNQDNPGIERDDNWHQNDSMSINWLYDEFLPAYDMNQQPLDMNQFYQQSPRQLTGLGQDNTGYSNQSEEVPKHVNPYPMNNYSQFNDSNDGRSLTEQTKHRGPASSTSGSREHTSQNDPETGHYYVDGDGARLPRVLTRRARRSSKSESLSTPSSHVESTSRVPNTFAFPENHVVNAPSPRISISPHIYEEILKYFDQTCLSSSYFTAFDTPNFPRCSVLESFVQSYLNSFQPILPFIHPGTFDISNSHWLLILALAAIGSHYTDIADAKLFEIAMHEFLRRAIDSVVCVLPFFNRQRC